MLGPNGVCQSTNNGTSGASTSDALEPAAKAQTPDDEEADSLEALLGPVDPASGVPEEQHTNVSVRFRLYPTEAG